ncbi:MAG: serine acetyltransferase [Deltaproteobacteria bacterium]|nr:serine acetyltransferase [Deltaproteobacteria bacterium]
MKKVRGREREVCKATEEGAAAYYDKIPEIVEGLVASCRNEDCFDHIGFEPISSRESVIAIIEQTRSLLFPGYFTASRIPSPSLAFAIGQDVTRLFDILSKQITLATRHDCLRNDRLCSQCVIRGREMAIMFLSSLPGIRSILATDVTAAYESDPAAKSFDEIIFSYPGLYAVTIYRMANQLYRQGIPLLPRIMTEHAHSITGIDIHPGATIGDHFFIDHGTGVVIGETTEIGNGVRIYQGVTLGALSLPKEAVEKLRNAKRHPTIEDGVIIYSGATILGGETVIGARSVIGGNVWITESAPPDTEIFLQKPDLVVKSKNF